MEPFKKYHIVLAAVLLLSAQACGIPGDEQKDPVNRKVSEPTPVVLGAVYNTTGRQEVLDRPSLNGSLLAADEINNEGGILGRPLELAVADGESTPSVVAEKTRRLIETRPAVAALLGLSDTDMALAAGKAASEKGRLFLTSGATSPRLPAEVENYLYLACFGDNVQAAAAAEWAYRALNARTVSIIFNTERTYTRLLHNYFRVRFEELGGEVLSVTGYTPDAMEKITDDLKPANIIFLASEETNEGVKGVKILRQAGYAVPILGGDGYDTPSMWAENPGLKDIYYTTHAWIDAANPDPRVVSFRQAYLKAYPGSEPDSFAALGYDAVRLLAVAVKRAGTDNPDKVKKALAVIRDFHGVTGIITYEGGSAIPKKSVALISIQNGRISLADSIVPDSVPAP